MTAFNSVLAAGAVAAAVTLAGCTTPPHNVSDGKIPRTMPVAQIRAAIVSAGVALGWQMADVRPGLLHATFKQRDHAAVVNVSYTATAYSIVYKNSTTLGEKDGQIHKNYNDWIQNLDARIQAELSRS